MLLYRRMQPTNAPPAAEVSTISVSKQEKDETNSESNTNHEQKNGVGAGGTGFVDSKRKNIADSVFQDVVRENNWYVVRVYVLVNVCIIFVSACIFMRVTFDCVVA